MVTKLRRWFYRMVLELVRVLTSRGQCLIFVLFMDMQHFRKEQFLKCSNELDLEDEGPIEEKFQINGVFC